MTVQTAQGCLAFLVPGLSKHRVKLFLNFVKKNQIKAVNLCFIDFSYWKSRHQFHLNKTEKVRDREGRKDNNTCLFSIYPPLHKHTRTTVLLLKEMFITCFLMVELRLPLMRRSEPPIGAGGKKQNRKVKIILYYHRFIRSVFQTTRILEEGRSQIYKSIITT